MCKGWGAFNRWLYPEWLSTSRGSGTPFDFFVLKSRFYIFAACVTKTWQKAPHHLCMRTDKVSMMSAQCRRAPGSPQWAHQLNARHLKPTLSPNTLNEWIKIYNIILLFDSIALSHLKVGLNLKQVGDPCFRQTSHQTGTSMQTVRGHAGNGTETGRDGTKAVANNVKSKASGR